MLQVSRQGVSLPPIDLIHPCQCAGFGYFFPEADGVPYTDETLAALTALHHSMVAPAPDDAAKTSGFPSILSSFGQFIDHDISSMVVLDEALVDIHGADVAPQPRTEIEASLINARTGWMHLDSLYSGDRRNERSVHVTRLHAAFLRLHNANVEAYPHARRTGDADTVFEWARTQTRATYQWLVLHDYLPRICDPVALGQVFAGEAALYNRFLTASEVEAHHHRPLPLEFTLAGLRNHADPAPHGGAIPIDITAMRQAQIPCTLRRGLRMNIPSAQACIDVLNKDYGAGVEALGEDQLRKGRTGAAVVAGGFDEATPLSFYLRKEAEITNGGARLGPLGTHIVAGTLVGLLISDPHSVWNMPGSVDGRWHPVDGAQPNGQMCDSLQGLMRGAGPKATPTGAHP